MNLFEVSGGITVDDDLGVDFMDNITIESTSSVCINKITVETILKGLGNSISFDIAKNHTGICIWDGENYTLDGFNIEYDYDKNDALADCKMRHWFKEKCKTILQGKHLDVCQVEGIYAGENPDTFRKLAILNTVVGELLLDGVFTADRYFNFIEKQWFKYFKTIGREGRGLKSKVETQEILKRLEVPFVLDNINKTESYKESIFFEDKCDALAMLCGVALYLKPDVNSEVTSSIGMKDIQVYYVWDYDELFSKKDRVLDEVKMTCYDLQSKTPKTIENEIKMQLTLEPDKVFTCYVDNKDISLYCVNKGWELSENGYGYLIFYRKDLKRSLK